MDATRIEALLRTVTTTASRRSVLAGLINGLTAGFAIADAGAKRKKRK
jgi:hypothetical protein